MSDDGNGEGNGSGNGGHPPPPPPPEDNDPHWDFNEAGDEGVERGGEDRD